jgi:hypothetical protein
MQATSVAKAPIGEAFERAMQARTLCEAFQTTAAARADQVALRTADDSVSFTYRALAERVRRVAAGLAALGLKRGDTVGIMLTNRPEFHLVDLAAMHLGAVAFSIYNTSARDQIEYLFADADADADADAGNRIVITERAFVGRDGGPRRRHADRPPRRRRRRAGRHAQPRGGGGECRSTVRLRWRGRLVAELRATHQSHDTGSARISLTVARTRASWFFDRVEAGEVIVIEQRGEAIAAVHPCAG